MNLKKKINNGDVFGTWCTIPSPEVASIISKSGLDFIIIDMEHGGHDFSVAQKMILAARAEGVAPVIRVGHCKDVPRALDIGSEGVLVPQVETVWDAERVVLAAKYAPVGKRGYSPYTQAAGYTVDPDYCQKSNEDLVVGIMVESPSAIGNLNTMMESHKDNLDVVYIGIYDISVSLGIPGQVDHPEVVSLISLALDRIHSANLKSGCFVHNSEDVKKLRDLGVSFFAYSVDGKMLLDAYRKELSGV